VVEHDWKAFLEKRLKQTGPNPPLDGITRGGWKVDYTDSRPELYQNLDSEGKQLDLTCSLGLLLKDDGTVVDVVPGKAADKAGIGPHMKVIAVNERKFTEDRLREALKDTSAKKFTLLVENAEYFKTIALDYRDGEKYPTLIRNTQKPDLIGEIFKPKTGGEEK
jgi:predicted metalloprotease with PDZ domain